MHEFIGIFRNPNGRDKTIQFSDQEGMVRFFNHDGMGDQLPLNLQAAGFCMFLYNFATPNSFNELSQLFRTKANLNSPLYQEKSYPKLLVDFASPRFGIGASVPIERIKDVMDTNGIDYYMQIYHHGHESERLSLYAAILLLRSKYDTTPTMGGLIKRA